MVRCYLWPGEQPKDFDHQWDFVASFLDAGGCSKRFLGWMFIWSPTEGIPIIISNFRDVTNFGLFTEFENSPVQQYN